MSWGSGLHGSSWSLRGAGSGIKGLILRGSSGEKSIGCLQYCRCSKLYYHY